MNLLRIFLTKKIQNRKNLIETLRIKKKKRKFIRKQKQENNWTNLTGKIDEDEA